MKWTAMKTAGLVTSKLTFWTGFEKTGLYSVYKPGQRNLLAIQ